MNARFVAFDGYQSARTRFSIRRKINCDSRQGKLQHGSRIINRDTGNKLVNRIETQASGSCFFFILFFFFFCWRTVGKSERRIIPLEHAEGWTTGSKLICLFAVSISSIIATIQAAISIGLFSLNNAARDMKREREREREREKGAF